MLDAIMRTADTGNGHPDGGRRHSLLAVQSIAQMVAHEQTVALGMVQTFRARHSDPGLRSPSHGRRPRPSAPLDAGRAHRILFGNPEA